ncbi:hypothetical protein GCK72_020970 [Caenorhabditis remanei]|uniref:BTB domain-containing protein n=1 Tax=Caenorhabditis remanei TaxID=31234 RepID=A0A6A5GJ44_CAERE|nr:hypothetical protein GCK72_020970 [Caenorhabditis remanei]KAF1754409.1 hypothetical protein GCK72_020970 [Caenorhabditis remanei]
MPFYDRLFVESDKTDAVLIIGKIENESEEPMKKVPKLETVKRFYVNKALLSYHSVYFKELFEDERSPPEYLIENVEVSEFAGVLSLIHNKPMLRLYYKAENLVELADRFQLPAAKRHLELFIMMDTEIDKNRKILVADKYKLSELLKMSLDLFRTENDYRRYCDYSKSYPVNFKLFYDISNETNVKLFHKLIDILCCPCRRTCEIEENRDESVEIIDYETLFAQSEKTDTVLVVDGKKMHVNKAILSYYSDYFNTLFNSDFKEKSMQEIPIKQVKFEHFATLLSLVLENPIVPSERNAEKLLVLSERFLMPVAKRRLELFIISSSKNRLQKVRIAEKFKLEDLMDKSISLFIDRDDFGDLLNRQIYRDFSDDTKYMPAAITGKFASFDQSDVVFLIGRHRLYGKKDLLTYHSTYFKDLFQTNLDSKKSPSEFRIDNVKFDEFSTLISLVQTNPLKITEKNAENLLQLADRFDLPSAKCHVELFLITSEKKSIREASNR